MYPHHGLLLVFWAGHKYKSLIDFHFRTKALKWKQTSWDVRLRQSCRHGVQNNHAAYERGPNLSGFRQWLTPGLLAEAATRGRVARGDLSLCTLAQCPAGPGGYSLTPWMLISRRLPEVSLWSSSWLAFKCSVMVKPVSREICGKAA